MSIASVIHVLGAGCGAIGSRLAARLARSLAVVFADNQRVEPGNVDVAAFTASDVGRYKAVLLAERHRGRGGRADALCGDIRYTLRPGLARALDMAMLCLDNPAAVRDAAESLWAARAFTLPVVMLTCGNDTGSYLMRVFGNPGLCPVCLFGNADRAAASLGVGTSCSDAAADAISAPRASAASAEAAAAAGAELLARWQAGDHSLAGCRMQRDGSGAAFVAHMPPEPLPRCPVPHVAAAESVRVELGGSIADVVVATLAQAAIHHVGDDAQILLGRRSVPHSGLYCPRCRALAAVMPRLLPAALAAWDGCRCGVTPQPLGERNSIDADVLLAPAVTELSLKAWGAGHGDEFIAIGDRGAARLCCSFDWSELDES